MTDRPIDYKTLCENYSQTVGCYNTFDGSCIKERCFTYKLLQQCERLKNYNNFDVDALRETNKTLLDEVIFLTKKIEELKKAGNNEINRRIEKY